MKKHKSKRRSRPKLAISIQQPYAEEILRGTKRYEFRWRQTHLRVRVYVYASRRPGSEKSFRRLGKEPGDLPTGVLVGTVDIVGCQYFAKHDEYGYRLENPKRLKRMMTPKRRAQP